MSSLNPWNDRDKVAILKVLAVLWRPSIDMQIHSPAGDSKFSPGSFDRSGTFEIPMQDSFTELNDFHFDWHSMAYLNLSAGKIVDSNFS
jgi:hypothetical protein